MTETLLPDEKVLHLEAIECCPDLLVIRATTCTKAAVCPRCGVTTRRPHSRYRRTLTDLPFRTTPVRIHLTARKFFCTNPICPQEVFAERIPSVAARHAQKTARLAALLREFAWLTGGEVAARLGALLGITASGGVLLDALTATQTQRAAAATPRILGVDDFAFRRRCRYGTVLVDMEQHRPVDLLPDREAKTLEDWLREHPGVEVVCRDRSTVYTEAVTKAAPNAIQVADRWHLVKNLSEALTRFFDQQQAALKQAAPVLACEEGVLPVVWPPTKGAAVEQERREHRGQRLERYEQVMALHRQGVPLRAIARQLGLARGTVKRYVACDGFPEIARHKPQLTSLDAYKPYLHRRWLEGCRNAGQLYREIQAQGFSGTSSWLARYITGLRRAPPVPQEDARAPSARSVAAMVIRRRDELTPGERAFLEQIQQASELNRNACKLADRFLAMVRQRRKELLPAWIAEATQSDSPSLVGFARSLQQDLAAVEAGLSLAWSNGPTEGQVNRLKLVKRSMYGRASFGLLKARVLPLSA